MAGPLISCIVPTHHSERYLDSALASIRAQSWREVEIVVADDDSAPVSRSVTRAIADRYGARSEAQARGGPAAARNVGLRCASGSFVAFLDADDLWTPEKLTRQMAWLSADPNRLICTTQIQTFSETDEKGRPILATAAQPVPGLLMTTLLARREAFELVGPLNPKLWFSDSADWFLRARDHGLSPHQLDAALTLHRRHETQLSRCRNAAASHEFLGLIKAHLDRQRATP